MEVIKENDSRISSNALTKKNKNGIPSATLLEIEKYTNPEEYSKKIELGVKFEFSGLKRGVGVEVTSSENVVNSRW